MSYGGLPPYGAGGLHHSGVPSSQSQAATMDDLNFLEKYDAEEHAQAQREIEHLPMHLRPDQMSQMTQGDGMGGGALSAASMAAAAASSLHRPLHMQHVGMH